MEEIISQFLNVSIYLPLSGSTYVKLSKELNHPMKELINVKNNDNKCFLWCHVRHLNMRGVKLCRITKKDREIAESLNYSGVGFPVSKKDYCKISVMNKININVFCYENKTIYPVYLSDQCFNDTLDLLLISNHYVYIKDFNRLMFSKNRSKNKKWFCKSCLQCFSNENILLEYGKDCLMINGGQNVKLEKGFIEFKNFNRQIPVPFKISADFAYKLAFVDDKFSKDDVLYRGKNAVYKFIQSIFREYSYYRRVMSINNNLVLTAEQNEEFERSNIYWIYGKLIKIGENKVRDHCHIKSGKNYGGRA